MSSPERAAVVYDWPWYNHLQSLVLWVVLLTCLLRKGNRCLRAWLVLVPLVVVLAIWGMVKQLLPFNTSNAEGFSQLVSLMAITLAVLWLLAQRPERRKGVVSFLLAGAILAGLGTLGMLCYNGFRLDGETAAYFAIYGIWVLTLLLGMTISCLRCRKNFAVKRFLSLLLLWMIILTVGFMLLYMAIIMLIESHMYNMALVMLMQVGIVGFVLAVALYVIALPYMILIFRNAFYRRRFENCFNLAVCANPGRPTLSVAETSLEPETL